MQNKFQARLNQLWRYAGLFLTDLTDLRRQFGSLRFFLILSCGVFSALMATVSVASFIPIIYVVMEQDKVGRYLNLLTWLSNDQRSWLNQHLPIVAALGYLLLVVIKHLSFIVFACVSSVQIEKFANQIRLRLLEDYRHKLTLGSAAQDKERYYFLCSALVTLNSFNWALLDLLSKLLYGVFVLVLICVSWPEYLVLSAIVASILAFITLPGLRWTKRTSQTFYRTQESILGMFSKLLDTMEVYRIYDRLAKTQKLLIEEGNSLQSLSKSLSMARYTVAAGPEVFTAVLVFSFLCFYDGDRAQIYSFASAGVLMMRLVSVFNETNARLSAVLETRPIASQVRAALTQVHKPLLVKGVDFVEPLKLIEFRNVSLGIGNKYILKNISFSVPAGSKVLIKGSNGSGKSSLVRCLLRLYQYEGTIFFNGTNVNEIDESSWFSMVGAHSQFAPLTEGTVFTNLTFGDESVSRDELNKRLKNLDINLNDLLPSGIDTNVNHLGSNLSGGQQQMIGLLRTLILDRNVLILDEISNHLSQTNFARVQKIVDAMQGKTIFIVDHHSSWKVNFVYDMDLKRLEKID